MVLNFDEIDLMLLFHLQKNGRLSAKEISKKIHLSAPAVSRRMKDLEDRGFIKQYAAILNKEQLGKNLEAFTGITLIQNSRYNIMAFLNFINNVPEVSDCYLVSGKFDFLLRIWVSDMPEYSKCITNTLSKLDIISNISTFFVLDEMDRPFGIDLRPLMGNFNQGSGRSLPS